MNDMEWNASHTFLSITDVLVVAKSHPITGYACAYLFNQYRVFENMFIDISFGDMFMLSKCILDYLNHTYTHQGLPLLTWIDVNPGMDNWLHP